VPIDLPLLEVAYRGGHLAGRAEARRHLDPQREIAQPLGEGAEVLLGEHGRGHQEHHLLAVRGRLERGPQRHLGLAVADVPADQPVHRPRLLHVGLDLLDRVELVGRLLVRERPLEVHLPVGVLREAVARAAPALRVQVDQLARQRLRRAAGAHLHLLPLLAAELGQRRIRRVGPDVAADLVELVARDEDAVAAAVLELEVVAGHAADGLRVEAGEAGDAVVLVHDGVAGAEVGERGDRLRSGPRSRRTALGSAAAQQAVLGEDGELESRRQEALPQARRGEREPGLLRGRLAIEERRFYPREVVRGALGFAAARPRHHRAIARAHQLLELRLRLPQVARGGVGALRAELVGLVAGDGGEPERRPLLEQGPHRVRRDVEVVGIRVMEARRHVLPEVRQRRLELLLRGDREQGVARNE